MRRSVSLLCVALATLGACTGGARSSRVPVAPPATPGGVPVEDGPRAPATERMVSVPSLVGLDLEAAAERAHAAGLELMALRVPGTPAGLVLEQNPAAGRAVPEGAPLRVRIASGNPSGSLPIGPSGLATGPDAPPCAAARPSALRRARGARPHCPRDGRARDRDAFDPAGRRAA